MIINPTPINYVPSHTGNTDNLGEIVIASNGKQYYIDREGRAETWHTTWGDIEISNPNLFVGSQQRPGLIQKSGDATRHRIKVKQDGDLETNPA